MIGLPDPQIFRGHLAPVFLRLVTDYRAFIERAQRLCAATWEGGEAEKAGIAKYTLAPIPSITATAIEEGLVRASMLNSSFRSPWSGPRES